VLDLLLEAWSAIDDPLVTTEIMLGQRVMTDSEINSMDGRLAVRYVQLAQHPNEEFVEDLDPPTHVVAACRAAIHAGRRERDVWAVRLGQATIDAGVGTPDSAAESSVFATSAPVLPATRLAPLLPDASASPLDSPWFATMSELTLETVPPGTLPAAIESWVENSSALASGPADPTPSSNLGPRRRRSTWIKTSPLPARSLSVEIVPDPVQLPSLPSVGAIKTAGLCQSPSRPMTPELALATLLAESPIVFPDITDTTSELLPQMRQAFSGPKDTLLIGPGAQGHSPGPIAGRSERTSAWPVSAMPMAATRTDDILPAAELDPPLGHSWSPIREAVRSAPSQRGLIGKSMAEKMRDLNRIRSTKRDPSASAALYADRYRAGPSTRPVAIDPPAPVAMTSQVSRRRSAPDLPEIPDFASGAPAPRFRRR
jgi:hypothetical protein